MVKQCKGVETEKVEKRGRVGGWGVGVRGAVEGGRDVVVSQGGGGYVVGWSGRRPGRGVDGGRTCVAG